MTSPLTLPQPFNIQGHRGARALFPENTLSGFIAAIALGVDSLELDVAITADGVAVVHHDIRLHPDLTRGPDGAWLSAPGPTLLSLSYAQTQLYDVGRLRPGSRTATLFPHQSSHDGARIPTLEQVLRATTGVCIDAEIKTLPDQPHATASPEVMADKIVAAAEASDALARLVVRSFDWRGLAHLRRTRPEIPLVWLTSHTEEANTALWWNLPGFSGTTPQAVARAAGSPTHWRAGWAPQYASLTREQIDAAHALGLAVLPWTVNDPGEIARLIAWGVDGICSDRPDLVADARAVLSGQPAMARSR